MPCQATFAAVQSVLFGGGRNANPLVGSNRAILEIPPDRAGGENGAADGRELS